MLQGRRLSRHRAAKERGNIGLKLMTVYDKLVPLDQTEAFNPERSSRAQKNKGKGEKKKNKK